MSTVKQASLFPAYYRRLKGLLCKADLVVGFAVKNDTLALERACKRYGLKPLSFLCLDMERLCRTLRDYPQAHGLAGYVKAYCGIEPDHQHRSDGDAFATMLLLREICKRHEILPKRIKRDLSACLVPSVDPIEKRKKGRGRPDEERDLSEEGPKRKRVGEKPTGVQETAPQPRSASVKPRKKGGVKKPQERVSLPRGRAEERKRS